MTELTAGQKQMLQSYGEHRSGIAWLDHDENCIALVRDGYLKLAFCFQDENYYGITKQGRVAIRSVQMG